LIIAAELSLSPAENLHPVSRHRRSIPEPGASLSLSAILEISTAKSEHDQQIRVPLAMITPKPGKEFFAERDGTFSAAGRRCVAATMLNSEDAASFPVSPEDLDGI
jgi:hypothetical protein